MAYSLRAYEYWLTVYRRVWRGTVMTSILNPVLYLTALGVGLGKLVNRGAHPLGIPYLDFVAPGMLAAVAGSWQSAMVVKLKAAGWTRPFPARSVALAPMAT